MYCSAHRRVLSAIAIVFSFSLFGAHVNASALYIGAASVSITPDDPVALSGQMRTRISTRVDSPVTASALAIESRDGDKSLDAAIMVSCDLVAIRDGLLDEVRAALKKRLPEVDPQKIFLSATHTHTAPEMVEGRYELPKSGIVQPEAYREFFTERVVGVIEKAWKSRGPGSVGWGLGHAVVAQNRIVVAQDGRAKMYAPTGTTNFDRFEGYEDHGMEVLCCWDDSGKLVATAINIACPAQEVEGKSTVDADIWHPIREALRRDHGEQLVVLGWTGAAGDQSPHLMIRKAAEERMRKLRGLERMDEIARRVIVGWNEAYAGAVHEKHSDAPLVHQTATLELPKRVVTQAEALEARKKVEELKNDPSARWIMNWHQKVVDRFEQQKPGDTYPTEIHVVRLGDIAIATNQFELYTDYGIQMKARSPALQTFVIQLTGPGTYLPTARGVQGGAYGSIPQSNTVGPEGGRVLVDRTVDILEQLWPKAK